MTSRILSQNATIIAISALSFRLFYVPKYPYTSMVANFYFKVECCWNKSSKGKMSSKKIKTETILSRIYILDCWG